MRNNFKIKNIEIAGVEQSIIAQSYPMKSDICPGYDRLGVWMTYDNLAKTVVIVDQARNAYGYVQKNDRSLKALANAEQGSGHDCFLKGIIVSMDLDYSVYWSPEFQRYHFADIVSSQSSMHRFTKMNLDHVFEHGTHKGIISIVKHMVDVYNTAMVIDRGLKGIEHKVLVNDTLDNHVVYVIAEDQHSDAIDKVILDNDLKHDLILVVNETPTDEFIAEVGFKDIPTYFEAVIASAPQGLMKTMRITTNALQLKSMIAQRENHKLSAWRDFCKEMKQLPFWRYFDMYQDAYKEDEWEMINEYDNLIHRLSEFNVVEHTPHDAIELANEYDNLINNMLGYSDNMMKFAYLTDSKIRPQVNYIRMKGYGDLLQR